jgi:hypothetical protein
MIPGDYDHLKTLTAWQLDHTANIAEENLRVAQQFLANGAGSQEAHRGAQLLKSKSEKLLAAIEIEVGRRVRIEQEETDCE